MIKELILLANALDKKGFRKEADFVDALIKRAYDIRFASPRIFGDEEGRVFVAIKLPDYGSKIFYKSTGTGGLSQAGDWVVMNGITITVDGNIWYIKDPGKIPSLDSWLYRAAETLAQMERKNGPIKPNEEINLSQGLSSSFTYSEIARFNQWVEEVEAIVPYAIKKGWGLIGTSVGPSVEKALELAKLMGWIKKEEANKASSF